MTERDNPYVEFAQSYGGGSTYLSASVAIGRCEQLLLDLDRLKTVFDGSEKQETWFSYFGFEVVSYYAVGFVTCLEWHARARLVDSVTFNPAIIEAKNFERISDQTLAEMMRANVTVPQVLGALLKINTFNEYCDIIQKRVLGPIGKSTDLRALLNALSGSEKIAAGLDEDFNIVSSLSELYIFRHQLVHEINASVAGPLPLRDTLTFETAKQFGQATLVAMKEVEKQISRHAPKDFPNLLDVDFTPLSEVDVLNERIATLEQEIANAYRNQDGQEALKAWETATKAESAAAEKRNEFLAIGVSAYRYFDPSGELVVLALRQRLAFLAQLASEVCTPDTNEEEEVVYELR